MRPLLSSSEYWDRWQAFYASSLRSRQTNSFVLFYSSIVDGFTRDPSHFILPVDDHGFHRGDGVFEAFKILDGRVYLQGAHLDRLWRSAEKIHLQVPRSRPELEEIIREAVELCGKGAFVMRLYVTRGPGGFGVSPAESAGSLLFLVVTRLAPFSIENWKRGVSLGLSQIPVKPAPFCGIKSLNYLPNVLMKREALEQKVDFTVGCDARGFLTEGATENLALINEKGELCHPRWSSILDGCTLQRLFELARGMDSLGLRPEVDLSLEDLKRAREVFLVGTTIDLVPVTSLFGEPRPVGPWGPRLLDLIRQDQGCLARD